MPQITSNYDTVYSKIARLLDKDDAGYAIGAYGTLRQGEGRSDVLKELIFIDTVTLPDYKMFTSNEVYPYIIHTGNEDDTVVLELYAKLTRALTSGPGFVDSRELIATLDMIEGTPTLFKRTLVDVLLSDLSIIPTYLYVLNPRLVDHDDTHIKSGDWCEWTTQNHTDCVGW